jgi:NifB/MoaA-like Fe-S oxidoreductase
MDPRVKASPADLQAEFDFAIKVRNRVAEANGAVVAVRKVRTDIDDRIEKAKHAERDSTRKPLTTALENLRQKLTEVEESVYQVKNQSGQDPLNFPIKLNNKIAHLSDVIESADAKPTDQTYAAFKELSDELQAQMDRLNSTMTNDVPAINAELQRKKIAPVSIEPVKKSPQ